MNSDNSQAYLVPDSLVPSLRLSKPLPPIPTEHPRVTIRVVHGEEFKCLGYLVERQFSTGHYDNTWRTYFVFTKDLHEAVNLIGMGEDELKSAYQMPSPRMKKDGPI